MKKNLLSNIKEFVEGNLNMLEDKVIGKPTYYVEQLLYRRSKCQDCFRMGACLNCGCDLPGKHYVTRSCNQGVRFPDLMDEAEWEVYKKDNNIQIDIKDDTRTSSL